MLHLLLLFLLLLEAVAGAESLGEWSLLSTPVAEACAGADGAALSRASLPVCAGAVRARVPCTVLGCLVEAGVYEDPLVGFNLAGIDGAQFDSPWWYVARFDTPSPATPFAVLSFLGLNYRASVWLNGSPLGGGRNATGAFRRFDYSVGGLLNATAGGANALAVQVFRPRDLVFPPDNNSTDLSFTLIDWAPHPPDGSMGLFDEVLLTPSAGPVVLLDPSVQTALAAPPAAGAPAAPANLTVAVRVLNLGGTPLAGVEVAAEVAGLELSGRVPSVPAAAAAPGSEPGRATFAFSPAQVAEAPLWWPWQMGEPRLVELRVTAAAASAAPASSLVGLRQVGSALDGRGHRVFSVNGHRTLVRGAGWAPDLLLRDTAGALAAHMALARDIGLNLVRLEGCAPPRSFFAEADARGMLVMAGWSCCDAWQHWAEWDAGVLAVAVESMRSQAQRLAPHPSVLVWLVGSDQQPPPAVERAFAAAIGPTWPGAVLNSAANLTSKVSGPSGVKMSGPYAYVPPTYWHQGRLGGAFGFLSEGSPGAAPLELASWERAAGAPGGAAPWPVDAVWDYHTGNPRGLFHDLRFFSPSLDARMGAPSSAAQYLNASQAMAYESHRAMFEAYSRSKWTSATGVVQWMLNSAWPSHVWHLFDSYLAAGGSYYGAKKAAGSPLHAMYSYAGSVWLVNSRYEPEAAGAHTVVATLRSLDGRVVWNSSCASPAVGADASAEVACVAPPSPAPAAAGDTYFLRVRLAGGPPNDYWLAREMDTLDWAGSNFYRTPVARFANLTALQSLGPARVVVDAPAEAAPGGGGGGGGGLSVNVTNPAGAAAVAFMVRLRVSCGGDEVLPSLWDDNYLTLFPGETRAAAVAFVDGAGARCPGAYEVTATSFNDAYSSWV